MCTSCSTLNPRKIFSVVMKQHSRLITSLRSSHSDNGLCCWCMFLLFRHLTLISTQQCSYTLSVYTLDLRLLSLYIYPCRVEGINFVTGSFLSYMILCN